MHHYGARLRSKRQNPKASISNAIVGTNTVAVYTKHQRLHKHEFAMHTPINTMDAYVFYLQSMFNFPSWQ